MDFCIIDFDLGICLFVCLFMVGYFVVLNVDFFFIWRGYFSFICLFVFGGFSQK